MTTPREPHWQTIGRPNFAPRPLVTNVYVKNDGSGNGPLIAGIIVVVIVLIILWWLLFAGTGTPAPTTGPDLAVPTANVPQGS
jgi:hypothetical protein